LRGVLDREFHAYPASRIGFLVKLGFLDRVRDAPFPE
jgi:hypothetical protein